MVKIGRRAVYNSRILYMLTTRSRFLRAACSTFVILLFWCLGTVWAGEWDVTEQQAAVKIVAVTGTGNAAVDVSNRSSLSPTDVEVIRRGLLERISTLGLNNANSAAVSVKVFLSENVQEYVWVAEIYKGSAEPVVVIVSRPRTNFAGSTRDTPAIALNKLLLWSSDSQILDALVINGASRMVVLYPGRIQFYRVQSDHWVEDLGFPVSHSRPWPRDLRGRLFLRKDRSVEAHLPGEICQSNPAGPLSVNCREADDPWPIGTEQYPLNAFFAQSRNFFTGVLSPAIGKGTAPTFYSAAPVPNDHSPIWLLATLDGHIHLLDGSTDMIAGKLNWGSDIASVHSSCGARWQILATSNGTGQEDTVRAYEMPGREPVAITPPLQFPGGITSLWTAPNDNGAVAVTRNSETGKYEAYLLTMACSQ
jgi:hypothetical protein